MRFAISIIFLFASIILCNASASVSDEAEARQILTKMGAILENPNGIRYDCKLQLSKIFKVSGTIIQKGKKSKFISKDGVMATNGVYAWTYDKKKNEITIMPPEKQKNKPDNDFDFLDHGEKIRVTEGNGYWIIRMKLKDTDAKEAEIYVDKTTYYPIKFKLKKGLFWMSIEFSNIETGNYADSNFEYEHCGYSDARIIDKR